MKNRVLTGSLTAALLVVATACAAPGTDNKTVTNTTTTTTSNTTRSAAPTNTSAPANSNAGNSNTSDSTASTQGKQDFTLLNRTGVEIHNLYVSPHDKDEWGEDILGRDTLADGQSVEITFNPKEKAALWDLKVTDSKGNSIEWESLNLMEISNVMLRYDDGKATAEVQ
ncbi:MAG: hypothetical protein WCF57_23245 [Pyrinomonadaceae bacterium]